MDVWRGLESALRWGITQAGASSAETTVRGARVHFFDLVGQGKGPPIVLLHGLASSSSAFTRLMFQLTRRFRRVLVPDLPGNGFSPVPERGPLPLEEQEELMEDFLTQVAGPRAFLVGSSLGGALSLKLAVQRPELLSALCLLAPAGNQLPPERMEALLRNLEVTDDASARLFVGRLFHQVPWVARVTASRLTQVFGTPTVRSILSEARNIALLGPEELGSLRVPTLLLWGKSERLLPYESVDFFRAHLSAQARVEVVEGWGHVPHIERPTEVAHKLEGFADSLGL